MVKATSNISEYKFHSFNEVEEGSDTVKLFEFKPLLTAAQTVQKREFQKIIKDEREFARTSNFKVNPIVEQYRGFKDQESREYEDRVEEEVKKRVQEIHDEAFKAGFEEGVEGAHEIGALVCAMHHG